MNNYIKMDNKWFAKENEDNLLIKYGHIGFMVYSILQKDVTVKNTIRFRIVDLLKDLKITTNNSAMINKIKNSLMEMNEKLFVICIDGEYNNPFDKTKQLNNTTVYYLKLLTPPLENKFFILYEWEINRIIFIERDKRLSRGTLLTQMGYYAKSFGGTAKDKEDKELENYKIHYCSIEAILKNCLLDDNTVIRNNKLLSENGIILYENPGMVQYEKNATNIYARVEDKNYFDDYVKLQKNKIIIKYTGKKDKEQQNLQKSLKQKINNYKKSQGFNEHTTMEDLTEEQHTVLMAMEKEYVEFVKGRTGKDKIKKGTKLITLNLDGTSKTRYIPKSKSDVIPQIGFTNIDGQPVNIKPKGEQTHTSTNTNRRNDLFDLDALIAGEKLISEDKPEWMNYISKDNEEWESYRDLPEFDYNYELEENFNE